MNLFEELGIVIESLNQTDDVDMSPDAIEERLREVSRLRQLRHTVTEVDMSPAAVERRLRRVSELRDLCRMLSQFTPFDGPSSG